MEYRNRIIGSGTADPRELAANPRNWRTHPAAQQEALTGALKEIGWVQNVVVNKRSGLLVDGHLRVKLAVESGQKEIPVVFVDLSEDEENLALATLDPVGLLAGRDDDAFRELLEGLDPETVELQEFIRELEESLGVDDGSGGDPEQEDEILLDQAVQHEPGKEYIIVTCANDGEWERLRAVLGLQLVRRGGYKVGSPFDAQAVERVILAARLFSILAGPQQSEFRQQAKGKGKGKGGGK